MLVVYFSLPSCLVLLSCCVLVSPVDRWIPGDHSSILPRSDGAMTSVARVAHQDVPKAGRPPSTQS